MPSAQAPEQCGRVVEGAEGLRRARRRPDAFDEALDLPVALQVTADRGVTAATRGDGDEFTQQEVDEQTAEPVAAFAVGAAARLHRVQGGEDVRAGHAQGRAAHGDDERGFVPFVGGAL
ncbi:hypothetical protein GCM10023238_29850 [Streptomyces heliomycini]